MHRVPLRTLTTGWAKKGEVMFSSSLQQQQQRQQQQ
jgi:hypothetical protein